MINIKSHINHDILLRHSKFITGESNIKENLEFLNKNIEIELKDKYLENLNKVYTKNTKSELLNCMRKFIEMLIEETAALKCMVDSLDYEHLESTNNLFIAKPKLLNEKINEVTNDYSLAIGIIEHDNSCHSSTKTFAKLIFKALQYNTFSLKSDDILGYKKFLVKVRSPNSDFYKFIKESTGKYKGDRTYDEERLTRIKQLICNDIKRYTTTDALTRLHEELTSKISAIEESKIKETISKICSIVENSFDECIDLYKQIDFTTFVYDSSDLYNEYSVWNAYKLVLAMGTRSCPYCNRQYITPVYSEQSGSVRADLDHFFAKSLYPYLSISLYNLIPCCKFCNSSLKSDKDFEYNSYIHPYEHGFENHLRFRFKPTKYTLSGVKSSELKIVLEPISLHHTDSKLLKVQNNAKCFKIEPLYNYHCDEVRDLIKKRLIYNDEYCQEIKRRLKKLLNKSVSKQELLEFIVSRAMETDRLHEQTLSKLYSDITEQLGFFEKTTIKSESIISNSDLKELKKLID